MMNPARIILLLCILLSGYVSAQSESDDLRVASYNIHHGVGMDGKLDLDRIATVLEGMQADVIALQEVDKNCQRSGNVDQAQYLAKKLGMHVVFGKAIKLGGGEYGQAILSKFPIDASQVVKLPSVGEQRIALAVVIAPAPGVSLQLVSVHFEFGEEARRMPQVQALEAHLKATHTPVLMIGDFNAEPESATMEFYRKHWQVLKKQGQPMTYPANDPQREIDYAVLRGWPDVTTSCVVVSEKLASDHRPLIVTIRH